MSEHEIEGRAGGRNLRAFPEVRNGKDGKVEVVAGDAATLTNLFGMKTDEAARGVFVTAINALGNAGDIYRPLVSAMGAELEPKDAIEAMLIVQMTATHVAMTSLCQKMMDQKPPRNSAASSTSRRMGHGTGIVENGENIGVLGKPKRGAICLMAPAAPVGTSNKSD